MFAAALVLAGCSIIHRGKSASAAGSGTEGAAESAAPAESAAAAAAADSHPAAEGNPAAESASSSPGGDGAGASEGAAPAAASGGASDTASEPPGATVSITYSHRGDYLASMDVSKFNGAETVEARNPGAQPGASIIRFDGGVTVWQIKASSGMFSKLPVLGAGGKFALKSVTYGKLPPHFTQLSPDSGPPEPLEVGHYYIFTAQRASGVLSYEAVRVEPDGSLDGYEAEPRAGTSYALCCNVSPDFVQPPAPVVPDTSESTP